MASLLVSPSVALVRGRRSLARASALYRRSLAAFSRTRSSLLSRALALLLSVHDRFTSSPLATYAAATAPPALVEFVKEKDARLLGAIRPEEQEKSDTSNLSYDHSGSLDSSEE